MPRHLSLLVLAILVVGPAHGQTAPEVGGGSFRARPGLADPLAHTYSIVARDAETGELGVAVQSHWFQVGTVVSWAEAGVGAVATQSFSEIDYGPKGLAAMREGKSAAAALAALIAEDAGEAVRQVAMIDAKGRVAVHTGARCIAEAGHLVGPGYAVQANLMESDTVWPAMAKAFEAAEGDLAERLLVALEAAQAEGGDIRGRQSAALRVVGADRSERPWRDVVVDLRVDDHPEPLVELRRLLGVHRAYREMNAGDEAMGEGRIDDAAAHYSAAVERLPEKVELPFWQAVTLWDSGRQDEAGPIFRDVFAREARWVEVVRRLPASGLLPEEAVAPIVALAPTDDGEADGDGAGGSVRLEGVLTQEGIECPTLRDEEGKLWTLAGSLRGFEPGDRVVVEGQLAQFSICMTGTTLDLRSISGAGGAGASSRE